MQNKKPSHWFDRHPRLTLLLMTVLGIVIVVSLAELIARKCIPQWAPVTAERAHFWQFDSELGWSQVPNRHGTFQHPDFLIDVSINSLGLRDQEYPIARTEKKRMLVLGDSYGWGFGVNHEEIFSELLEARHPDWEIINASVSGYGTVQEYEYLAKRGLQLKPDVVLLLFFDNDFQDSVGKTEYWYNKPIVTEKDGHYAITGTPVAPLSLRQRLDAYFLGNFYVVRGLYSYLQIPVNALLDLVSPPPPAPPIDNLAATAYVLGKMMDLTQANGMKLVVVETPLSDAKHAAIEQQCIAHGVPCLHLNKVFKRNTSDWHFAHDRHWNVLGHRMAADAIDEYLHTAGVWGKPGNI